MSAGKARHAVPNYRYNYQEHKKELLDLFGNAVLELNEFQKWAETEDHAAEIAESIRSHMHDTIEKVCKKMHSVIEQRKSMGAPESPSDELGYPIDNESIGDESDSGTSNATVMPRKNTTESTGHPVKTEDVEPRAPSWKGKAREVNPLENVIGTYMPPAMSMGKGKEPAIPYSLPITRSSGESSRTRLDGSNTLIESKNVVTDSYISLVREVTKFKANWGPRAADHLNIIARSLQLTAEDILTGRLGQPGADSSPTLNGEQGTTVNRHLRTSKPPTMPSHWLNKGEGTTSGSDSSERRRALYKIIIPPRKPKQLPPREMRKRTKLFYDRKYVSNVDDELGGEVKGEEESLQFGSISQAFRPVEGRTRYNLRSRKPPVAGPSQTRDEPVRVEQKRNKKEVLKPEASKRTNRKRHVEDEEDSYKKRCREDEVKKREAKKQGSNKKRKRDDDNVKEETKTRKRTKRK